MDKVCEACGAELKYHPEDEPLLCELCDRCPTCRGPGMGILLGALVLCTGCLAELSLKEYVNRVKEKVLGRAEQIMKFQLGRKG